MTSLLKSYLLYVDEIKSILVKHGRALYAAGKPYSVYAETINMLSAKKPVLRRQLQAARDLALYWLGEARAIFTPRCDALAGSASYGHSGFDVGLV